jgi:hypothetical protein
VEERGPTDQQREGKDVIGIILESCKRGMERESHPYLSFFKTQDKYK